VVIKTLALKHSN